MIFDFILDVLRRHEASLHDHASKKSSNDISDILQALKSTQESVSVLQDKHILSDSKVQALEDFQEINQQSLKSLQERIESLEQGQASQDSKLDMHETFIKELLEKIDKHEVELSKNSRILDIFRQDLDSASTEIEKSQKNFAEIKEKTNQQSVKITDHEKRIHNLENDIKQALKAITSLGGELEEISKPSDQVVPENTYVDSSKIDELSESLRNSMKAIHDFEARIRGCEENSSKARQSADRADTLSKNTEIELRRLEELMKKIDIKNSSGKVSSGPAQDISKDAMDSLRKSYTDLENAMKNKCSSEEVQRLFQDLKARLDEHEARLGTLEANLSKRALKSDMDEMFRLLNSKQVARVEETFDSSKLTGLSRRVGSIEDSLKFLVLPEGFDLIIVTNIILNLQREQKESKDKLEKNLKDLWNKIKELEESLNKKVNIDQFKLFEDSFNAKLKDLLDECIKRFADKNETKRAFKYLEKLIKDSESIKIVREGDDAMLAKKPLGGWSCASCQKDLEKLMGKVAPYQPWNRLPYRDPADRIARAGPGFSRMLATVQPEQFTSRNKNSAFHQNSPPYSGIEEEVSEGLLPSVKKQLDRPFTSL